MKKYRGQYFKIKVYRLNFKFQKSIRTFGIFKLFRSYIVYLDFNFFFIWISCNELLYANKSRQAYFSFDLNVVKRLWVKINII